MLTGLGWGMGALVGQLALFQPTANRLRDKCAYKADAQRDNGLFLKCWHHSQFYCEQKVFCAVFKSTTHIGSVSM